MKTSWVLVRHYFLHLIVSLVSFIILSCIGIRLPLFFLLLGTYLPDTDHLPYAFDKTNAKVQSLYAVMQDKEVPLASRLQKLVRVYWQDDHISCFLLFHNFIAVGIVVFAIIFTFRLPVVEAILTGIVVHQATDLVSDIQRWGHVRYWL